jgi:predicted Rossmann fold nucleotide-binding protein DprA/Smf involved in DNA uptake
LTGAEAGFLLLTSQLGNPERRVLTASQLRILSGRVRNAEKQNEDRDLTVRDLMALGYGREMAERMIGLLNEEELLRYYLRKGEKQHCYPLTRVTQGYPSRLRQKLGEETPGCLWCKGDIGLLSQPMVALVGSRDLKERNRHFARAVGRQAARQGFVLVSGNARGADQTAQNACLQAGGKVICVVADSLEEKTPRENVLYLSEDGFDCPFSAQRAISRNRVIHTLTERTFVAQSALEMGGTWDGTMKNLRHGWSKVYCFADGSVATEELTQMGAETITENELENLRALSGWTGSFLEESL